jgi:hypothetical protein
VVGHVNVGCLESLIRIWNGNRGWIGIHFGVVYYR